MTDVGRFYVYTGEGNDAIAIAKNGVGPNGGWTGIQVATMPVPRAGKTREQINADAHLIVTAVNEYLDRVAQRASELKDA